MPTLDRPGDALGEYAARLYSAAQTLTLDAATAGELVERVYRRAYAVPDAERPADPMPWLYSLLLSFHDERLGDVSYARDVGATNRLPIPDRTGDLRRRLALDVVHRTLPSVLVTLPEQERLLLHLCYVDRLSPVDAGRILGLGGEEAIAVRDRAWERLEVGLRHHAAPAEREILTTSLPPDWLPAALARASESLLAPLPPTLGRSIADSAPAGAAPAKAPPRLRGVRRGGTGRVRRALTVVTVVVAVGMLGVLLSEGLRPAPEHNLITLSARDADDAAASLATDDPAVAERFIEDRFGTHLRAPVIEGAALTGVGYSTIAAGVEVPLLRYEEAGGVITVYAFSYALLDRVEERARLTPDVLNQIADEQHFDLYDEGANKVVVWRHRDDVFLAVTRGDAEALTDRIVPAS